MKGLITVTGERKVDKNEEENGEKKSITQRYKFKYTVTANGAPLMLCRDVFTGIFQIPNKRLRKIQASVIADDLGVTL
jgi:hypothetical protein